MNKLAIKIALLLTAPAVLAQPGDESGDPFEFLLNTDNTVMTGEQASGVVLAPVATVTNTQPSSQEEDPFAFLLDEASTVHTPEEQRAGIVADDRGAVRFTLQNVSDDNFTFGRYNGMHEEGVVPLLDVDYRNWFSADTGEQPRYLQLRLQNVGSDVGEAEFSYGKRARYKFTASIDQQLQVNNNSGRTPFSAGSKQVLPDNWVASNTTSGMTGLNSSNREFSQELERNKYLLSYAQRLSSLWSMGLELRSEEKEGNKTIGAAHYINASSPLSSILAQPVDQTTNELDMKFQYKGEELQFNSSYLYSRFENNKSTVQWQNPYDGNYGEAVDHPNGFGQIATEPDTDLHQLQAQVSYLLGPYARTFGDVSYSLSTQDESFVNYTINPALEIYQPLPRTSLDGEIGTTVANAGLLLRPLDKLTVDFRYSYYDRNNDSPRDGYLYPRGDSMDQPASLHTIYNRPYESTKNTFQAKARYRLPKRMRLSLEYQFENISRYNSAVEETDESMFEAALRFVPTAKTSAKISLAYSDRAASRYNWDQSFYALLDTELINLTPDNQRYINHPALSQYYIGNREMLQAKFNLGYMASQQWSHNLDFLWDDIDYDESELGLTEEEHINLTLSSNYQANEQLTLSGYYSYDNYQAQQMGRSFRGGAEKNAFTVAPPYPQASDPSRNWASKPENSSHALGVNAAWDIKPGVFDMVFDYSFIDTSIEQRFQTYGASDLSGDSLPDDGSQLHHLKWDTNYYYSDSLSFSLAYQYYRFSEDRWAIDGVNSNTLGKVIGTGERAANDNLHIFALSVQFQLP